MDIQKKKEMLLKSILGATDEEMENLWNYLGDNQGKKSLYNYNKAMEFEKRSKWED